ncbi:MAG TPA: 3-oxoacyl-ACP reductase FabG [Stellaceae bacterium]|nr:3-oxoacyl-ACP reductase FabG [Stellaceae bacterium]
MTREMVFFVTGGSRGIGAAIALRAAQAGHDVALTYVRDEAAALDVVRRAREIRPAGHFAAYRLDVRRSGEVETVGDQVLADFDTVDVVVANAGINRNNLVVTMSDDEWHAVLDTNLSGAFYVCRQFLPTFLAKRFGRFILMSSLGAGGVSGQANHCASKSGLLGLSATLAKEYGRKGITSNVISPGLVDTDMTRAGAEAVGDYWRKLCPLGRLAEPSEIAELVTFLASPAAAYINGQELKVNGGLDWAP